MKKTLGKLLFSAGLFFIPRQVFAADASTGIGCGGGLGPLADLLCGVGNSEPSRQLVGTQLNRVISQIIGILTIVAALWFLFQFITAGLAWIGSSGDKHNLEEARNKIINAIIGLIIVVAAYTLVGIFGRMLGIDIFNPGDMIVKTLGL